MEGLCDLVGAADRPVGEGRKLHGPTGCRRLPLVLVLQRCEAKGEELEGCPVVPLFGSGSSGKLVEISLTFERLSLNSLVL